MIFSMLTRHAPDFFCSGSRYACLFVCVCMCPPYRLLKTIYVKSSLNSQSNKFLYMTLAIDTIDGWALVTIVS